MYIKKSLSQQSLILSVKVFVRPYSFTYLANIYYVFVGARYQRYSDGSQLPISEGIWTERYGLCLHFILSVLQKYGDFAKSNITHALAP